MVPGTGRDEDLRQRQPGQPAGGAVLHEPGRLSAQPLLVCVADAGTSLEKGRSRPAGGENQSR